MESKAKCDDCALGSFCFTETSQPADFKAKVSDHIYLDPDQILYQQGQQDTSVAVVQQGGIKICQTLDSGMQQIIDVALPGDYVGLSRLFQDQTPVTAQSLTRTRICLIDPSALTQSNECNRLLKRELESGRWHQSLSLVEAPGRIAQWILRLADYNERRGLSPSLVHLPLSRTDMANYLLMALETASRALKKMQTGKLINVNGRQIEVLDRSKLKDLAQATTA